MSIFFKFIQQNNLRGCSHLTHLLPLINLSEVTNAFSLSHFSFSHTDACHRLVFVHLWIRVRGRSYQPGLTGGIYWLCAARQVHRNSTELVRIEWLTAFRSAHTQVHTWKRMNAGEVTHELEQRAVTFYTVYHSCKDLIRWFTGFFSLCAFQHTSLY